MNVQQLWYIMADLLFIVFTMKQFFTTLLLIRVVIKVDHNLFNFVNVNSGGKNSLLIVDRHELCFAFLIDVLYFFQTANETAVYDRVISCRYHSSRLDIEWLGMSHQIS